MDVPRNAFKQALRERRQQIGIWVAAANSYGAELIATTGFDWLLIDAEHAPNDPRSVLTQLQAVAPYPVHPIVRPVRGDTALIKQYLDLGVQTLLVPMVETAEQAAEIVAATRYPTRGVRGVGSAVARASRWNQVRDYLTRCEEQICVLVQVESIAAMGNLAAIAAVDGVDGVFFGPADLAASMGLVGKPTAPAVEHQITEGIATVRRAGKAAGTLMSDKRLAHQYLGLGALFVAVGIDTSLLVKAATELSAEFKAGGGAAASDGVY